MENKNTHKILSVIKKLALVVFFIPDHDPVLFRLPILRGTRTRRKTFLPFYCFFGGLLIAKRRNPWLLQVWFCVLFVIKNGVLFPQFPIEKSIVIIFEEFHLGLQIHDRAIELIGPAIGSIDNIYLNHLLEETSSSPAGPGLGGRLLLNFWFYFIVPQFLWALSLFLRQPTQVPRFLQLFFFMPFLNFLRIGALLFCRQYFLGLASCFSLIFIWSILFVLQLPFALLGSKLNYISLADYDSFVWLFAPVELDGLLGLDCRHARIFLTALFDLLFCFLLA